MKYIPEGKPFVSTGVVFPAGLNCFSKRPVTSVSLMVTSLYEVISGSVKEKALVNGFGYRLYAVGEFHSLTPFGKTVTT